MLDELPLSELETVDMRPGSGFHRIRLRSFNRVIEFRTNERDTKIDNLLDLIDQQRRELHV